MRKKTTIKSLYLVVIGDITNTDSNGKSYVVRTNKPILAHAKYSIFNKGRIKYFKNIIDNTKYFTKESFQYTNSLCAIRYCPASTMLDSELLKRGYIYEDEIEKYLNSEFAKKFIEETLDLQVETKSLKKENDYSKVPNKNYYTVLTDIFFRNEPIIGREREMSSLILTLAQLKNNPLLIGEPGVGKTILIDELAYMIQKNKVPNILKDRIIIEISAAEILSGTKYRGEMEDKLIELSKIVKNSNAILFIDNFHNVLKSGSTEGSTEDIASILKKLIDRDNIKVIGATSKENYDKFISKNDLKDRFETITVEEPDDKLLYDIINYTFDNYSKKLNISIENLSEKITNVLIELTKKKHRRYNDEQNNPRLVIGIIDKAFAVAAAENSPYLTHEHIISSINLNERIYNFKKQEIIKEIEGLSPNKEEKEKRKILMLRR